MNPFFPAVRHWKKRYNSKFSLTVAALVSSNETRRLCYHYSVYYIYVFKTH